MRGAGVSLSEPSPQTNSGLFHGTGPNLSFGRVSAAVLIAVELVYAGWFRHGDINWMGLSVGLAASFGISKAGDALSSSRGEPQSG